MLPEPYLGLSEAELKQRVGAAKSTLGKRLVILGHHYQREGVIEFADFRGDSFGLSKKASETDAEYIVFCGVHFMAESARILAKPEQRIFHPDLDSGCPMADMASILEVTEVWEELGRVWDIKKIVPIVYMNSHAALKAFCGRNGGLVCTSSNAVGAFDWALKNGDKIFFFPDEHLGRNTARARGIARDEVAVWKVREPAEGLPYKNVGEGLPYKNVGEGLSPLLKRLILWPGYCHVHTYFTLKHIKKAREDYPGCKIIVHPECSEDVVMAADANASTGGICRYVISQPAGATIIVGTEINLVNRLAHENPDRKIVPLARSLCPNMFKISLGDLCFTLEQLVKGEPVNEIKVPEDVAEGARIALERMLTI